MPQKFPHIPLTEAVQRIWSRFSDGVCGDVGSDVRHLVHSIVNDESLGARCLKEHGVVPDVTGQDSRAFRSESADSSAVVSDGLLRGETPEWAIPLLERAVRLARHSDRNEVSSVHLVRALVTIDGPGKTFLLSRGMQLEQIEAALATTQPSPVAVDFELYPDADLRTNAVVSQETRKPLSTDSVLSHTAPLVDANLNRAREGLRVLEDYSRFVVRCESATAQLKTLRHDLVTAELRFRENRDALKHGRNVAADVGTHLTTPQETFRGTMADVITANARRVQESLRSLEEFGKLLDGEFAASMKQLRYRSYDLEQHLGSFDQQGLSEKHSIGHERRQRLLDARLYVLLTEQACQLPWKQTANALLEGGADIIQLREKQLSLHEFRRRSAWLQSACHAADVLFVVNDHCATAVNVDADGVHVGQEDDTPTVARDTIGSTRLLGLSTHNEAQLQAAAGVADYLGVGPVFTSKTKQFDAFAGPGYVELAAKEATIPWFAIGGINMANVSQVAAAGATRIAVSNAVIGTDSPGNAARDLRSAICEAAERADSLKLRRG